MPDKPSSNEEEYFQRLEAEKLERLRREAAARKSAEEREARKKLHWMKCPKCGGDLAEERYHGVAVDRCGDCKGIWFDAGEAESLLEKELSSVQGFFSDLFKGFGTKTKQ
jgi:hypothetical protein